MKWFTENKTKITGAIIVLIGFLQLTDNAAKLQALMGENVFAIWNLVAGGIVVVLGFWNTAQAEARGAAKADAQRGFVRLVLISILACACVVAAMTLVGCQNTKAAYAAAESPDEVAFVVAEHYAATVKEAAAIATAPGTPPATVRALQVADQKAGPIVTQLKPLRDAYLKTKSASDGATLQAALNAAVHAVADLVRAVKAAKGGA